MRQVETDKLITMAAEVGAKTAIQTMQQQREQERQNKHSRLLYNTKELLRHYRLYKEHAADAVFDSARLNEDAFDVIRSIMENSESGAYRVEAIQNSAVRSYLMAQHIERMVRVYGMLCKKSCNGEDMRRYRVIRDLYFGKERLSAADIAEREHINERTVYKDVEAACEKLAPLIFGIDGLCL